MMGEGEQPEAGYTFYWDTGSSAVPSTGDKNRHSPHAGYAEMVV